jgi:hypothetical protein
MRILTKAVDITLTAARPLERSINAIDHGAAIMEREAETSNAIHSYQCDARLREAMKLYGINQPTTD